MQELASKGLNILMLNSRILFPLFCACFLAACASQKERQQRLLTNHMPDALAGSAHDQFMVGGIYWNGHPKLQNHAEAFRWLSKAAAQGYASAQLALGCMYLEGEGVAADSQKAFQWFEKAATNSEPEPDAMYLLGLCYRDGKGTDRSRSKAVEWLAKAYALAVKEAGDDLAEILKNADDSNEATAN